MRSETSVNPKSYCGRSRSGAPRSGEPGTHNHGVGVWIPGSRATHAPRNDAHKETCDTVVSELPPDQKVIEGIKAAAVNEEIEGRRRPHQRVFEAERIPEIAAHPPTFDVRHRQKDEDRYRRRPREQAEREEGSARELGDRDRRRPQPAGTIAGLIKLRRQCFQAADLESSIGEAAES